MNMSTNERHAGLVKSSENPPIMHEQHPTRIARYPASEIDLIDIGVLLWCRRRIVLSVFLLFLMLTVIAVFLHVPTYQYTATIEIGSRLSATGDSIQVVSSDDAQEALQNMFLPMAMANYAAEHPEQDALIRDLDITAKLASDKAGTISLTCKAKKSIGEACINIEEQAASEFIKNTSRQTAVVKANYEAQLTSAQLALATVKSPAVFSVEKTAAEAAIAQAENNLKDLQAKAAVLKIKKNKLAVSKDLYQQEVSQLEQRVSQINQASVDAAKSTATPTQAMANLVLSTQAQNNQKILDDIQQKLAVEIPQQEAELESEISGNLRAQALAKQSIQQNKDSLQKLLYQHGQNIQSASAAVKQAQSNLDNIQATRVLGKALQSLKPVGVTRGTLFIFGALLSILLAFLAAFAYEYLNRVRARLAQSG